MYCSSTVVTYGEGFAGIPFCCQVQVLRIVDVGEDREIGAAAHRKVRRCQLCCTVLIRLPLPLV